MNDAANLWEAIERRDLRALTQHLYDPQQLSRPAAQEGSNNAGLGTGEAGDSEEEPCASR